MVQKLANGLYRFKNGAQAKKLANGQYRIVKGASKQYMAKIRKQRGGTMSTLAKSVLNRNLTKKLDNRRLQLNKKDQRIYKCLQKYKSRFNISDNKFMKIVIRYKKWTQINNEIENILFWKETQNVLKISSKELKLLKQIFKKCKNTIAFSTTFGKIPRRSMSRSMSMSLNNRPSTSRSSNSISNTSTSKRKRVTPSVKLSKKDYTLPNSTPTKKSRIGGRKKQNKKQRKKKSRK